MGLVVTKQVTRQQQKMALQTHWHDQAKHLPNALSARDMGPRTWREN